MNRSLFLDLFFIRCCGVGVETEDRYMLTKVGWPYRFTGDSVSGFNELMQELWQKHTGSSLYLLLCKVADEVKK